MSARRLSQFAVLALVLLGTLAVGTRYRSRQQSKLAWANSLWRMTYDVSFEATPKVGEQEATTLVQLGRPSTTPSVEVVHEDISESNPSLHVQRWDSSVSGNREFRLTTRHAGTYNVTAEFDLRLHADGSWNGQNDLESLSPVRRRNFTSPGKDFPIHSSTVGKVLQRAPGGDATDSERLQWFFDFCLRDLERAAAEDEGDDVLWALAAKRTSPLGRAKTFVTLCRAVDIPARLVSGFELRHNDQPRPQVWTEVHRANRWIPFDPVNGFAREMPNWFVPIRRGGGSMVQAVDAKILDDRYSILRLPPDQEVLQAEIRRPTQIFDLTRLPVQLHDTLSLMLLLPLGALITAILRNIVGIRTLGTFAPALLAMSFIYAAWGTGLVILTVVVIVGLVGRTMLEKLHLLMVPRLSIILTTIIICVVFAVSLLNYVAPEQSAQTVLIPLVILTILIERFFVTSEEDSTGFAVQLVLGTVVVAAFCYLLLRWDDVGNLVLIYPELHLFTIAVFILIGRYSGYRLTELWRFRDLVKDDSTPTPPVSPSADWGKGPLMTHLPNEQAIDAATVTREPGGLRRFWAWPHELRQSGILGINDRNVSFILENNPRKLYPLVDNKLLTKQICLEHGIPVPETYGVFSTHGDVKQFDTKLGHLREFVAKPACGAAGRGIVVVADRIGNTFYTSSGREIHWSDFRYHLSTTISGLYSLGGQEDSAILERRIVSHPMMMSLAVEGTPDIRVIVYRGVPAMAMIRLPTTKSSGKANLHQGAVAAAIDLATGRTFGGVCGNRAITHHPDTRQVIAGIEIPGWRDVLDGAMRLSDALDLGYLGVDFVIDAETGPVVLEANARPGLAIQLAHRQGILPRLRFIDSLTPQQRTGKSRWDLIPDLIGHSTAPLTLLAEA